MAAMSQTLPFVRATNLVNEWRVSSVDLADVERPKWGRSGKLDPGLRRGDGGGVGDNGGH